MPDDQTDELGDMLADGWEIAGYTVNMLALGAQHFNILLRKGNQLTNFSILHNNGKELVRGAVVLAPAGVVPPKKGFWG